MSKFSIRVLHVARYTKSAAKERGIKIDIREAVEASAEAVLDAGWPHYMNHGGTV